MMRDDFGKYVRNSKTQFMEPAWKMMWSNKALLAILWELFPTSEYLLPTYFGPQRFMNAGTPFVEKPFIGREGANIRVHEGSGDTVFATNGPYSGPSVYQQKFEIPSFDGNYPVLGSWVIDGQSAGMGIREDDSLVTGGNNRFVPHLFV
jgi:glutathionylspermidine synthase